MSTPAPIPSARPDYDALAETLRGWRLPQAVLQMEVLEANAQALLARAGELPIRLASPSLRCPALLRHLQSLSPRLRGLLCHDAREALWLAAQGFDDIVLARPTVDAGDLRAIAYQNANGRRIGLAVDDAQQIDAAEDAAREYGCRLPLLLDVNLWSRFAGARSARYRSALREPKLAARLARRISASNGLVALRGVLAFEAMPFAPRPLQAGVTGLATRRRLEHAQRSSQRRRQAFVAALHDAGFDLELVLAGSSHNLEAAHSDRTVNELSAGAGFYRGADGDSAALLQVLPVTRRIGEDIVVCSGSELDVSPQWPTGAQRLGMHHGSGALALQLAPGDRLELGTPVFFAPASGAQLAERCARLLVLRGNRVIDEWLSYRGEQQLFS